MYSRRHQQHYHSQRREHPRDRQERPVSNFYEYESVQAAMHAAHAAAVVAAANSQSPPGNSNHHHHQHHPSSSSAHVSSPPQKQQQQQQQQLHHPHHPPQHNVNMSPPPAPSQTGGLVLHGQPIYGMSTAQLQMQHHQQNRLNNNNGITLPSPSGPFTVGMHQTSPSQFQVITTPVNSTSSSGRPVSSSTMERGGTLSVIHPSALHPNSQYPQSQPQ